MTEPLEDAWREHWARLLAQLVGQYRRPDLAEDALADAFATAARSWPVDGVPRNPAAWLHTAARRRVLDRLRAEAVAARKEPLMVVDARERAARHDELPGGESRDGGDGTARADDGAHVPDDRLRLVLACCHPALSPEARTALTLRFVAGLPVADIARLFLVQESTMAARLTRAKKRLAASGIPFAVPAPDRLDERLDVVATVLYLVFTAGYAPGSGPDVVRTELAGEAIRLARLLDELVPGRPVVRALLALMVLQHSRRDARTGPDGGLVLLADQDRSRWRRDEITAGLDLLATVLDGPDPSVVSPLAQEYLLQARIAAEHASSPSAPSTDWPLIAELYGELEELTRSPVVRLARSVAVAEAAGAPAGLALLDGLDEALPRHHRLYATRGELLARSGRADEAAGAFATALALCANDAEREHLEHRLRTLTAPGDHPRATRGPAADR
ncbi:RNA polymerase sigma factor [Oerskovia flava]|uniref:RNA polymerase sigma factor n=1 Tax=Oerskovia flava TaxID=2986422 RepID=UPI00223EC25A|nr:DUF6596 domain-containing protein [Oerskovia sp. JB1-3-2]